MSTAPCWGPNQPAFGHHARIQAPSSRASHRPYNVGTRAGGMMTLIPACMNQWVRLNPSPKSMIPRCEASNNPTLGTQQQDWEEKHKQVSLTFRWLSPRFLGWISFLRLSICLMSLDYDFFSVLQSPWLKTPAHFFLLLSVIVPRRGKIKLGEIWLTAFRNPTGF